jgi:hypothetical protein
MVVVEILVTPGCPREDAAIELVGDVARTLRVRPWLVLLEVVDLEQANRESFPGSPTIRVNGRDVDPTTRRPYAGASLACRDYAARSDSTGLPDRRLVKAALRDALDD